MYNMMKKLIILKKCTLKSADMSVPSRLETETIFVAKFQERIKSLLKIKVCNDCFSHK